MHSTKLCHFLLKKKLKVTVPPGETIEKENSVWGRVLLGTGEGGP